MGNTKQINIKNKTYYFYNDLINIKDFDSSLLKLDKNVFKNMAIYFDSSLLKLDKNVFKNMAIYYIGYIIKKDEYKINSVNSLYLLVDEIDGFIECSSTEEKEGSIYLNISFTDRNSIRKK